MDHEEQHPPISAEQKPLEATLARLVLHDCEAALEALKHNPQGVDWRLAWCSALTLLRAVGHVLEYEMEELPSTAQEMREAHRVWWKGVCEDKSKHAIFWEFIREHRNALLKEYSFKAEQSVILRGALGTVPVGALAVGGSVAEPTYLMKDGPFSGQDQRNVVQHAIDWWHQQLHEIVTRAATLLMIEQSIRPAPQSPT